MCSSNIIHKDCVYKCNTRIYLNNKENAYLELLSGPIADIQKKYEILSDIVTEYHGKVHGSQSHIIGPGNSISLIVYFEVPEVK